MEPTQPDPCFIHFRGRSYKVPLLIWNKRMTKGHIFFLIACGIISYFTYCFSNTLDGGVTTFIHYLDKSRVVPYDVFLISSYYYEKSESLGNDSISMVLTGPYDYHNRHSEIHILSWNSTANLLSKIIVTRITPHSVCLYIAMFAAAPVVHNPTHIAISQNYRFAEIPFTRPSPVKRDVVVCIAPLFANEQWQLLTFAVHTYRKHGAFMHLYARSFIEPLYRLAVEYEKMGYMKLEPWLRITLNHTSKPWFNPNLYTEFRNQAAAQTDCLLQYKESAQYISFVDLDDVLIPRLASTYIQEFDFMFNQQPNIGFIFYDKQNVHIRAQSDPAKFSLRHMISSIKFVGKSETGKMVTRPAYINCTWIHFPPAIQDNRKKYTVPRKYNAITHLRHLHIGKFPDDGAIKTPTFNVSKKNTEKPLLEENTIRDMQNDFHRIISSDWVNAIWNTLPKDWFYFDIIADCYYRIFYQFHYSGRHEFMNCPGPDRCEIPPRPGVPCANADADFYSAPTREGLEVDFHFWKNARFTIAPNCQP